MCFPCQVVVTLKLLQRSRSPLSAETLSAFVLYARCCCYLFVCFHFFICLKESMVLDAWEVRKIWDELGEENVIRIHCTK